MIPKPTADDLALSLEAEYAEADEAGGVSTLSGQAYLRRAAAAERDLARAQAVAAALREAWEKNEQLSWNLMAREAEVARLRSENDCYRTAFGCSSCGEDHPRETMCPPHEVRTTGQEWFRAAVSNLQRENERLRSELAKWDETSARAW